MNKLTIRDLTTVKGLEQREMAAVAGGIYRTPQQILAWELTGQPATWQGLVLGDDGRLHIPAL